MEEASKRIIHDWLEILFAETSRGDVPLNGEVLMKCANAHYRAIGMERILQPMKGDLQRLISFLQQTLGWIVHHDAHDKTIVADENKPDCVCPLYKEGLVENQSLCDCSRGFIRQMFSQVLGHDVKAEVVRSVVRGGSSCIYKVMY